MWTIKTHESSWPVLSSLRPNRVLDEYDGPRLFTVRSDDGHLLLAYQCAEDRTLERFLLVPASERTVSAILENAVSLRDALTGSGWAWLIDRARDGTLTRPAAVELDSLPDTALPRPGVRLNPEPEVLLRVRLIGDELTAHHVPASVVKRAVDGATGAVKTLVRHSLSLLSTTGRPAEFFRRYYDLPAVGFAFHSFEIAFGAPEALGQLELDEQQTLDRVGALLTKGLAWATAEKGEEPEQTAEWSAVVEALAKLAPPQKGAVSAVEVSGVLAGNVALPIRLSRRSTERISQARKRLPPDRRARTFDGVVREFDKDRLTFILRNAVGENLCTVSFSEAQYEDALLAFDSEMPVTIVAYESSAQQPAELISLTPKAGLDGSEEGEPDSL